MPLRILTIALIIVMWTSVAVSKDMALVSHKSNSETALSMPDLTKICKGQTNRWPDGKPVMFVTRSPESPEMKLVLEKVYGMSKDDVLAAIATANHARPNHPAIVVVDSDDALVRKVEATPGSVGLVDVYSITGGVKVIRLGGKLPLEPGYPLHGN